MSHHVFLLTIRAGQHERLRELNEKYASALRRVTGSIAGLNRIDKYVIDDTYVERIDLDGDFADFGRQLAADSDVRAFLRQVDDCFEQSLRDMSSRELSCLQTLPG